jgi:hypothetical protein
VLAFVLLAAVAVPLGLYWYNRAAAERALQAAVAATDQLDPQWRLADVESRRGMLPPEDNAAVQVRAAAVLIPDLDKWGQAEELQNLDQIPPQCQLDAKVVNALRKTLQPAQAALPHLRKAAPLKTGWTPLAWTPDYIGTIMLHVQEGRCLGMMLRDLALLQSQDGDHAAAWQTTLTILAVGRSFGEEPDAIAQLARLWLRELTAIQLERCLAQEKVSDGLLAEAQSLLAEETRQPVLYYALRGERAGMHQLFQTLEADTVRTTRRGTKQLTISDLVGKEPTLAEDVAFLLGGNTYKREHAWVLAYMNEAVAASRLPPAEQLKKFEELAKGLSQGPPTAQLLVRPYSKVAAANVKSVMLLDCARAGLGVECFRLREGRWPAALDELVTAKLLDKVPLDPYDGKPLRFRQAPDGVVVYSVGPQGNYGGDALDAGAVPEPPTVRAEFRLWDEAQRRQPARGK